MGIVRWIKKWFSKVRVQSLEELKEELRVTEEQIHIGTEIAKANPNHPQMWDSVFFRADEANRLRKRIKEREEEND